MDDSRDYQWQKSGVKMSKIIYRSKKRLLWLSVTKMKCGGEKNEKNERYVKWNNYCDKQSQMWYDARTSWKIFRKNEMPAATISQEKSNKKWTKWDEVKWRQLKNIYVKWRWRWKKWNLDEIRSVKMNQMKCEMWKWVKWNEVITQMKYKKKRRWMKWNKRYEDMWNEMKCKYEWNEMKGRKYEWDEVKCG